MSRDRPKMQPGRRTVMVHRARNAAEAHIIQMALEDGGIPAIIEGEVLQNLPFQVPPWDAAPRILVAESQAAAATKIIRGVQSRKPTETDSGSSPDP